MKRCDLLVPVVLACLSLGCSESTGPDNRGAIKAEAITPTLTRGVPEGSVAEVPAVRVYNAGNNRGVAARIVVFTLQGPDSVTTAVSVATDADGLARLPAWRMGLVVGRYTATAVTGGMPPIVFTAVVRGGIVAVFDLLSIDGLSLPYGASVSEGHYILYEDGTYHRVYNRSAEALNDEFSFDKYRWVGTEIRFYVEPGSGGGWGYRESNYQYAHGLLNGNTLKLDYTNSIDFGSEVYSRRPAGGLGER